MRDVVGNARSIGQYSLLELARLAGVSPRRVARWHAMGAFPATGRLPHTFSYADAAEAVLAHYLVDEGLRPGEVARLVENLRDRFGDWPLGTAPLEHEGRLVVLREDGSLYVDTLHRPEQRVIEATLDLRKVRDALAHGGWVALRKLRESIEVDPERLSGMPTVRGRRLPTVVVAEVARELDGRDILREEYGLSPQEIEETLSYEEDVQKAIAA
jgi:uncharacterized protein (DUF433 family)